MPRLDKQGPPKSSTGSRDGAGKGKGRHTGKGIGTKKGGQRGLRPNKGEK